MRKCNNLSVNKKRIKIYSFHFKTLFLISVSKKTSKFSQLVYKKLQEQGLLQLKTKEFTNVEDCFHLERNAVIGVFL